jgi:hypothetical protein
VLDVNSCILGRFNMRSSNCELLMLLSLCRGPLLATTVTSFAAFARPAAAASFVTSASIIDQVTFKEMGMLSWLIVDVAIQWFGWGVSTILKVCRLGPWAEKGDSSAVAAATGRQHHTAGHMTVC